jgi:hypothetical protein
MASKISGDPPRYVIPGPNDHWAGRREYYAEQAEPPGTEFAQVLVCENSARFVPAIAMLVIDNAALLAFVTVIVCGILVAFVAMVPKSGAAGDAV